jgi:hypothetical protein
MDRKMSAEMRSFSEKALLIALDALGAVAVLITIGTVVIIVGSIGAFLGFSYAQQHDLSASAQHGVVAIGALLAPVWLCAWLWRVWQRVVRPDDGSTRWKS